MANTDSLNFTQINPLQQTSNRQFQSILHGARARVEANYPGDAPWPFDDYPMCPHPIFISQAQVKQLAKLNSALHKAAVALVQRWWSNPKYIQTVPVSDKVERVLRKLDVIKPFVELGAYRPDWLIAEEMGQLQVKICEINARFGVNAWFSGVVMMEGLLGKPEEGVAIGGRAYGPAQVEVEQISNSFERHGLFDPTKPLAILLGKEVVGHSILFDVNELAQKYQPNARIVHPESLHLVRNQAGDGWAVSDNIGILEQFYLHLHQSELEAMDELLLLEIGKHCFNDLRTIFLVHDKAMLGLLREEASALAKENVLTEDEAQALKDGIVETYLPSSEVFATVLEESLQDSFRSRECGLSKDQWVLKKRGSGKGDGMVIGKNVGLDKWISLLREQMQASSIPSTYLHDLIRGVVEDEKNFTAQDCQRVASAASNSSDDDTVSESSLEDDASDSRPSTRDTEPESAAAFKFANIRGVGCSEYILQPLVIQRHVDMIVQDRNATTPDTFDMPIHVNWKVCGTSLCVNDEFLGVHFRTNPTDIVALARGGVLVAAAIDGDFRVVRQLESSQVEKPSSIDTANTPSNFGENPMEELIYPSERRIKAHSVVPSPEVLAATVSECKRDGLAIIDIEVPDLKSEFLVDLTNSVPELGEPISHSSTVGILWDIRPQPPTAALQSKSGCARSETDKPFAWHTDCSYETNPPRYFALHIVHADHKGGGKLRVLETRELVNALSPQTRKALQDERSFEIYIPSEFEKDSSRKSITGSILSKDEDGNWKLRYRRDILHPLTEEAERALNEVEETLEKMDRGVVKGVKVLGSDVMRDGTLVCLDNARWLHARSKVMDMDRLLRRVRWGAEEFERAVVGEGKADTGVCERGSIQ